MVAHTVFLMDGAELDNYLVFTDKATEAQRGTVELPKPCNSWVAVWWCKPGLSDIKAQALRSPVGHKAHSTWARALYSAFSGVRVPAQPDGSWTHSYQAWGKLHSALLDAPACSRISRFSWVLGLLKGMTQFKMNPQGNHGGPLAPLPNPKTSLVLPCGN